MGHSFQTFRTSYRFKKETNVDLKWNFLEELCTQWRDSLHAVAIIILPTAAFPSPEPPSSSLSSSSSLLLPPLPSFSLMTSSLWYMEDYHKEFIEAKG